MGGDQGRGWSGDGGEGVRLGSGLYDLEHSVAERV